jgi:putative addiction module component (TIGR02574 family)
MNALAERVMNEVMELPADARIDLVEQILASLNLPIRPEIERLWAAEAERRIADIDQGKVELIPGEVVFDRIRKKYA